MQFEPRDIFAILGAIAGLGGTFAYFMGNRAKSTIELQAAEIKAQRDRITTLESDKTLLTSQLHKLQGEVNVLRDLATGSSAIQLLGEQIIKSFEDAHAERRQMFELLTAMTSIRTTRTTKTTTTK